MGNFTVYPGGDRTDLSGTGSSVEGGAGYGMNYMVDGKFRSTPPMVYRNNVAEVPGHGFQLINVNRMSNPSRTVMAMDWREDLFASWPFNEAEFNRLTRVPQFGSNFY
jgi:hypothetical protein